MTHKYLYIVGGALLTSLLFGCVYSNEHQIKGKNRTVEYGTNKSEITNVADWIEGDEDTSNISMSIVGTTDSDCLEVGTYKVVLKDSTTNSKGTCTLTVEDTTAPVWQKTTDTIDLQVGQELVLSDYFEASDLSEVSYSTKDEVDTSKEGSTQILVLAQDTYENETEYACTVNVVNTQVASKTSQVQQSESSSSITTQNQQITTTPSQQQATTQTPTTNTPQEQPAQIEEEPVACEAVPTGAYTDYREANLAAQEALTSAQFANGWMNGFYKISIGQTNCGIMYYTYEYGER